MLKRGEGLSAGLTFNSIVRFVCEQRHAHLTGADMAGLLRVRKLLAIAIDAMIIGAALTFCTTGA